MPRRIAPAAPVAPRCVGSRRAAVTAEEGDGVPRNTPVLEVVGDRAEGAAREPRPLVHYREAAPGTGEEASRQVVGKAKLALEWMAGGPQRDRGPGAESGRHHAAQRRPDAAQPDDAGRASKTRGGCRHRIAFGIERVEGEAFGPPN